jgi:16S rRNA (adenine1518-N6/adenine1519-N6)-dimethyltransferase
MEQVDIVDSNDKVIGKCDIDDVYKHNHLHRVVLIFVFNKKGEMFLQLRSITKSYCPGYWTAAVGGRVQSGEEYIDAAIRECKEEIGVSITKSDLTFIGKETFGDDKIVSHFVNSFKMIHDGPFEINDKDVDRVESFSLKDIQQMVNNNDKIQPEVLFILKRRFGIK